MKTQSQLNRMTRPRRIEYFEDAFRASRKATLEFGPASFSELAAWFRASSLAQYPACEPDIDSAIRNTLVFLNEGNEAPRR